MSHPQRLGMSYNSHMHPPTLSVVITVWNESKNLPRVVRSVADLADEIIVVDTESTDDTVKVAKGLGCQVFHHANTRIVEPVRNFSISKANGKWVLVLDADEEVPAELSRIIKGVISDDKVDFVKIPRKSLIFGSWITSDHWWPDYVYRLFKKGFVTWQDTIHSAPKTKGVGLELPADERNSLLHHHYETIGQYLERINRYTDVQAQELISRGVKFDWPLLISKPTKEFINQFFARKAYLNGLHGLTLSLLQAFSEMILYAKLWQNNGFIQQSVPLPALNFEIISAKREYSWWFYQKSIEKSLPPTRVLLKLIRKFKSSLL